MILRLTGLLFSLLPIVNAGAESGCPAGQVPQQGNGWRSCIPLNNNGFNQGTADKFVGPRWTARWAALAIDDIKPIVGKSDDSKTVEQAEISAVNDCTSQGGTTCHPIVSAKNGCVVIAAGFSWIAGNTGPTLQQAEAMAMNDCRKSGDTGCRVYESRCAEAIPE